MILKTKQLLNAKSPQTIAGQKQETNVAFFLRRAYKDNQQVLVINDFKFTFNDETAQIDHLIIYPYGFVLIESKSIKGHVKVNKQGEWTRSYSSQWKGIPSPIKQVELQQALLKALLREHRTEILGKMFGITQGIDGRCWDHLCAISSDAVIDRDNIPSKVSDKLVKSEFVVDKLNKLMNIRNRFMRVVNISDTRPDFSQKDLGSIGSFLLDQCLENGLVKRTVQGSETCKSHQADSATTLPKAHIAEPTPSDPQKIQVPTAIYQGAPAKAADSTITKPAPQIGISCKHCGESNNTTPMYGKFGYFVKCNICTKNTPMKQACVKCGSKSTKVQKRKETYTLNCQDCGSGQQVV
ncbi:NERD domain-containing protein [Shewanella eurypsychrophilus]|uniref:NERD domain-containing protein n=1 Tax=Shewanella eurypsychrophilus TaxID=2593656 RepID=A0ABX6VE13_9GAMM|nr:MULTISPECIES: nuclease-related domain-containing protein [Shewanella]QFU24577.1 nuclease [Shewanella sp. YLB-09]QPG59774.1 NERD domain-containing protein [Shewanella eurypsychrophilus]